MKNVFGKKSHNFKHGMIKTRFYTIWALMKDRCLNIRATGYKHYGGRGIKVCEEWLQFKNFRDDLLESYNIHVKKFGEKNTTIERIHNGKGYFLSNIRWATLEEQARNKRSNHLITYKNKTKTLTQWAKEFELDCRTLTKRLNKKWPLEKCFEKPTKTKLITFKGKSLTWPEWSKKLGVQYNTLKARFYAGMPLAKILSPQKLT